MKTKISIITVIFFLLAVKVSAQQLAIDKVESYLEHNEFNKAIPLLEELSTFKNGDIYQYQLGYCYLRINAVQKADSTFSTIKNVPVSEYYFHFAEVKQRLGMYAEAFKLYEIYKGKNPSSPLVDQRISSCQFAISHSHQTNWNVQPNTSFLHGIYTGGCYYMDRLWLGFDDSKLENATAGHNLYASNSSSHFTEYVPADAMLKSKYHIGGITFDKNSAEVIYSIQDSEVSKTNDKKLHHHKISNNYLNTLNLYMGTFTGTDIVAIEEFPFNSREYSCMHPHISNSGTVCYFSSDMPGGYGGFDIYVIEKRNNTWSLPINMGDKINTKGDEMYPYEFNDSVLYFSSNGLTGYGGADIFKSEVFNHIVKTPVNLGMPANSSADDFGINFIGKNTGYFFSNRNSEPGSDGLFSFDFITEIDYDTTNGLIIDALTQEPLSDVKITIKRGTDTTITLLNTDSLGNFNFDKMLPNQNYTITAQKNKYHDAKLDVISNSDGTLNVEMELDPVIALNSIFTLNNILFEYNDFRLTQNSMLVLDKVAAVMLRNPKATFEIGAHTDSRGWYDDNMILSQRRADSSVYYLLSKGVALKQILPMGYGEKYPKNVCDSDSHCSEEMHAVNRRVEIKVIQIAK